MAILDLDVCGPSMPRVMGLLGEEVSYTYTLICIATLYFKRLRGLTKMALLYRDGKIWYVQVPPHRSSDNGQSERILLTQLTYKTSGYLPTFIRRIYLQGLQT